MPLNTKRKDPFKRNQIVSFIRSQVYSGAWKPGDSLPPRTWFSEKFAAVPSTLQAAFRVLLDAGLLETTPRIGTRITSNPHALFRFAILLLPFKPDKQLFSLALCDAVELLRKKGYCLDTVVLSPKGECGQDTVQLYRRIHDLFYSGVFLQFDPSVLASSRIFTEADLPVTGLFDAKYEVPPFHVPFHEDGKFTSLFPRMCHWLHTEGCRKIAILVSAEESSAERENTFRSYAAEADMECPPGFYQDISLRTPEFTGNIVRLLFSEGMTEPPDGILVSDDNLLSYVIETLRERYGPAAADRVKVVSIGNYPRLRRFAMPVKYFGVDLVSSLENALAYMKSVQMGHAAEPPKQLCFEESEGKLLRF